MPQRQGASIAMDAIKQLIAVKDKLFNGVSIVPNPITFTGAATTNASGIATFYLTDDGTAAGNAIFPNSVIKSFMRAWVDDETVNYTFGSYTVSGDRKTLTIKATKPQKVSASLLGVGVEVLVPLMTPAVGVVVNMVIRGN